MSLAPGGDLRDNVGIIPDLIALFLRTRSFPALTLAAVLSPGFPHPKTPGKVVGTVLLLSILLTLVPWVFLWNR
jgi:hypothetical protein